MENFPGLFGLMNKEVHVFCLRLNNRGKTVNSARLTLKIPNHRSNHGISVPPFVFFWCLTSPARMSSQSPGGWGWVGVFYEEGQAMALTCDACSQRKPLKSPVSSTYEYNNCQQFILFSTSKMNLRNLVTSEKKNTPVTVFGEHQNETWRICTCDGFRGYITKNMKPGFTGHLRRETWKLFGNLSSPHFEAYISLGKLNNFDI